MKLGVLRDVRRFLIQDLFLCDSSKQQKVDECFVEWLLFVDDVKFFYDLR